MLKISRSCIHPDNGKKTRKTFWPFLRNLTAYFWILCITVLIGCQAGRMSVNGPKHQRQTYDIAVLSFQSSNPYLPGSTFSDHFTARILQTIEGIRVIERKDLALLLEEQKFTISGMVRNEQINKLGSILMVDAILAGTVETIDIIQADRGTISVTVKLTDVASGRILWADRQTVTHSNLFWNGVNRVAEGLMEKTALRMVKNMREYMNFEASIVDKSAHLADIR